MKTRKDVADLMTRVFAECQETRDAGQKEYAHDAQNALANFERTGGDLQIPREKVLYIFLKKHWDGVLAWINGHRSQRENVRGRIKDMIVYLVLLWALIDDEEQNFDMGTMAEAVMVDKDAHLEAAMSDYLISRGYSVNRIVP